VKVRATGAIRPGFLKGVDDALVTVNLRLPLPASSSSDVDAYGGDGVQLHRAYLELPPPPAHLFARTGNAGESDGDPTEGLAGEDATATGARSTSPSGLARFGWRSSSPKPANAAATSGGNDGINGPSTANVGGTAATPADQQRQLPEENSAPELPPHVKVGHVVLRTANLVAPSLRRDPELLALPWARPAVRGARVELQFTVTGARSLLPLPNSTATNALESAGLNGVHNSSNIGGVSNSSNVDNSSGSAPVPTKLNRDPYIVVSWAGREIGKSRVQYRTLEPSWNLRMKFTLTRAEWDSAVEDYNLCAEPAPSAYAYALGGGDSYSPPAPTLMEHFGMLFNAHDADGSGELEWSEFWEVGIPTLWHEQNLLIS